MEFGPVPTGDALGAILAHSVRAQGKRLRKGLILKASHIEALNASGVSEVVVARLGPDDTHDVPGCAPMRGH